MKQIVLVESSRAGRSHQVVFLDHPKLPNLLNHQVVLVIEKKINMLKCYGRLTKIWVDYNKGIIC